MATFGKCVAGVGVVSLAATYVKGSIYTLGENAASVESCKIYGYSSLATNLCMYLYETAAGHPTDFVGVTENVAVDQNGNVPKWWEADFNPALGALAAGDYFLGFDAGQAFNVDRDDVADALHYDDVVAFGDYNDPFVCDGHSTREICICCSYTAAGAPSGLVDSMLCGVGHF